MIAISLGDIAQAVLGELVEGDPAAVVTGKVTHDSRDVDQGDLFVAIVGERFDGHEFVDHALASGAVAALVTTPGPEPAVVVADTTVALGLLAREVLRRQPDVTTIAVTGSSGKTSTKDMLSAVFSAAGPTIAPPGSFNNDLGLPMTVLEVNEQSRWMVLEMGARGRGHIARLCGYAQPDISIALNVGSAHLGEFGSVEGIFVAKREIIEVLKPTGVAVLNADDPFVTRMAEAAPGRIVWFGTGEHADVQLTNVVLDDLARPLVTLRIGDQGSYDVQLATHGEHQASNAAAAAAAGLAAGLPAALIIEALAGARAASRWRMELSQTQGGFTVINDSYNANPESMAAGLRALGSFGSRDGKRWAVLGEMKELGPDFAVAHREVGQVVLALGIDRLVGIGEGGALIVAGAIEAGMSPNHAHAVTASDAALSVLTDEASDNDIALFKASRSVGLEVLVDEVIEHFGGEK